MGKKFLVLGDMLELGKESKEIHKALGIKIKNFNLIFCIQSEKICLK